PGNGKLPGGRVEWLRLSPEEDSESVQAEAKACALLLRRCKEEGFKVWEEKEGAVTERPFEWKDGAILFQRRLNLSVFEEALRREGIPCRIHQGKDFFLQPEVIDLVNLTAFLADPTGDLPLLAVLRSPLFALSDEVLLWIAEHPGKTLWRRLSVAALPEPERKERTETPCWISEEERERVRFARGALLRWRELSGRAPPSEILSEVLLATSFWTTAQIDKGRPQAAANVERLLALARAEEARGLLTLSELAEKWTAHIEEERPEEEASPEEEGPAADAVSLLTVHAAKGLEFPVAVLPELSASFYREGPRLRFARAEGLHLGSGVLFGGKIRRRSEPGEAAPSPLHQLLDLRERREQRAEKARLFYVACTRARDALFLVSTSGAPEEQKDKGPTWRLWLEAALGEPEDGTLPLAGGGELRITKEAPKPGEKPPAPPPPDFSKWLEEKPDAKIQAELEKRLAPLPAPAVPLFLSPSLLEHYEHCPLRYRYKNVLQIPEGDPFPAVSQGAAAGRLRGKLFHKAIEKSTEALPPRELALALAAEAGELLRDEDVLPPEGLDLAALAAEVAEEVLRFSKSALFKALSSSREVLRELPFQWRLGEGEGGAPLFLSGRIDLLFRHPETGRLTVVDFKTDRPGEKPRLEQAREKGYDGQVRRYALAVRALSGEPEVKGALYWAAEGFYQEIPTAPSDLDAERARLLEAGRVLLRGEFPPTEDEKKCRECGYYKYRVCERWEVDPVAGEGAAP
ncbi:MAG: PD-(D/E)XK nuclease family protein, partial [Bdellovibrionota bacterium]